MSKKRKKKIKKIYIIILILLIMIIISLLFVYKLNKSNKNTKENKKEIVEKGTKKENNPYKEYDFYIKEYQTRYENYHNINQDFSYKQVVINVNMNLDKNHYTDATPAINLDSNLVLVNKYNYLENTYEASDLENINTKYAVQGMKLRKEARIAFEEMAKDITNENMKIIAMSSYRSYQYQENLYNKYKAKDGQEKADTYSARAGFSEHQTGLAVDIYNGKISYTEFENTQEFTWMQNNAYKYGFILRFQNDKTNETGYMYESWHYRYVGEEVAKYIYENKISYEEYYATILVNKKSS